ncbi:MAG: SDR family oxidoreductase [Desulfobulbaceae bacterium]|nr:MAG: SDR family oxidoreductase [Desulfobulbaceae bacterium]
MRLQGKTALVPGASRPVGRAIARRFAAQGAGLVLPVHDWPDSNREMEDEFRQLGVPVVVMAADLRAGDEVASLAAAVREKFGRLDFLINNIERGGMPVVHGSYDHPHNDGQWELEIATTLTAKWLLYHHCLPLLQASAGAAVVNISSVAGITGRSGAAALLFNDGYSAANRAVSSFTETWAREAGPGVRVNELVLGLIQGRHGEGTRGWDTLTGGQRDELMQRTILGRSGTPEEVAAAVWFLAVEAGYMTGAVLRLDGGFVLGGDRVPAMPPGIL